MLRPRYAQMSLDASPTTIVFLVVCVVLFCAVLITYLVRVLNIDVNGLKINYWSLHVFLYRLFD